MNEINEQIQQQLNEMCGEFAWLGRVTDTHNIQEQKYIQTIRELRNVYELQLAVVFMCTW